MDDFSVTGKEQGMHFFSDFIRRIYSKSLWFSDSRQGHSVPSGSDTGQRH